ncbi:sulfotransferase family protein [Leptolyngbya sp. 15MV]|nr:sulfotransferase family protein [Leptolyngbya sp. 15MV]
MEDLFQGRFDTYFRDAAVGDSLCVFVHVPKTAGTSLRGEIAQILSPDVNIAVDYTDTTRSFHDRMDDAVEMALVEAATSSLRFASGHILARHVTRIRNRFPDTRFVTFLRDPVARLISDYRYQRSTRHPVHAEFIARVPDLDAYLEIRAERNKTAQHLVPADILLGGDAEECVEHVMRSYAFIGVQEMYPISFRALTTLCGQPGWPKLKENVNNDSDGGRSVTPEVAKRIREVNAIDCAIYDAVFPRWQRVRDDLARYLA